MKTWKSLSLALTSAVLLASVARADDKPADDRLRASLKETMMQLRQAQTDLATAQAAQASLTDENKALKDQVTLLTKHSAEDRAAAEKTAESLKAKETTQAAEIAKLQSTLEEWKAAAEKMNAAIKDSETARAKAETDGAMLSRKVEDLRAKNRELYRLAKEILNRYQKFSLGEQFQAREPFIGTTRVYLENLIQDYDDKISDQKAAP